jgi:hypothetical protein
MNLSGILALGLSGTAVILGLSGAWLPAPLPSQAPPAQFSAERAWQHVSAIARKPHNAGTEENLRVRAYLVAELSKLGLTPRVLPATNNGVHLGNIYAEIAGSEGRRPVVLLVTHYDSVPSGPGAADCASGVATLLETSRALRASSPLRNGIALLFTDGEELMMPGARAFVRDYPELWHDARVVLNLEGRGNHGPVLMFEASSGAARLIAQLSEHCPYPIACSYSREVYRRLPNDTDFTEFLKVGCAGMNFSFVGGLEYYHSPRDTPENLSRRTLQHYGSYLLPLVTAFGQANISDLDGLKAAGESTFFPLWRGCLVQYSQRLATALAWLTPALFVAGLWCRRRSLRPGRALGSLFIAALTFLLSVGLGFLAVKLLRRAYHPAGQGLFVIGLPFAEGYLAVLVLAAAVVTLALNTWVLRRLTSEERLAGAMIPWLILTLVTAWYVPGASYLFLWPALLGTLALFLPAGEAITAPAVLRSALTAMPAPLLLAGTIYLMNQAVTIGFAPVSMGLVALASGLVSAHAFWSSGANLKSVPCPIP